MKNSRNLRLITKKISAKKPTDWQRRFFEKCVLYTEKVTRFSINWLRTSHLIAWRNYKYHKFLSRVRLGVAHKTSTIPAICTYLQQAETSQISINWTSSFRSQMGRRLDASSFTPRVVPRSPSCPTKSWVREVMNAPQSNVNTRKQI